MTNDEILTGKVVDSWKLERFSWACPLIPPEKAFSLLAEAGRILATSRPVRL
jgi:hypothetical protein